MKKLFATSIMVGLTLSSVASALPLALNTANSIILDGSKVTVNAELVIPHDFPQFYIQNGKVFGNPSDLDDSKPSCMASFTVNHKDGDCKISEQEVLTMGPTTVATGTFAVSCGKSDPSLRGISLMVALGNSKTLRLDCVKDNLIASREHLSGNDIHGIISNQAITFQ